MTNEVSLFVNLSELGLVGTRSWNLTALTHWNTTILLFSLIFFFLHQPLLLSVAQIVWCLQFYFFVMSSCHFIRFFFRLLILPAYLFFLLLCDCNLTHAVLSKSMLLFYTLLAFLILLKNSFELLFVVQLAEFIMNFCKRKRLNRCCFYLWRLVFVEDSMKDVCSSPLLTEAWTAVFTAVSFVSPYCD